MLQGRVTSDTASPAADIEDARLAAARTLLPLARVVFTQAKQQADAIGRIERRFGAVEIMHLARLLDDLWMAADNLICDLGDSA
jgi:hypothetical protein